MINRKSYTLLTPPAAEPVSLADVKTFLRIDGTADDSLLAILIASARRAADEYTKRAFITQTWLLTMDSFADDEAPAARLPFLGTGTRAMRLSRQPVQSITSIVTTDASGTTTTVPTATYSLDAATGSILRSDTASWPSSLRADSAVAITFVAGWATAADVPAPIRLGILQHVAASYTNKVCGDIPAGALALYDPFRLPEAFGAF